MAEGLQLTMDGGWQRAISKISNLANSIKPEYTAQLNDDADLVLEKLQGHIQSQDLGWAPLAQSTITLKGGDSTIMVETGTLMGSFQVKRVSRGDVAFFIGPSGSEPRTGVSSEQVMLWLENGTDKMPPRPLLEPTMKEVEDILRKHWKQLLMELCR